MTLLRLLFLICTLTRLPVFVASSSSSGSGASWQPPASDSQSVQEANQYAELGPITFSPAGRLHPFEMIVEVAKSSTNPRANLVLAMNCKDAIVLISNLPTSPYLNTTATANSTTTKSLFLDQEQNSVFYQLSSRLVAATAGNLVDGKVLGNIMHQCSHALMQQSGTDIVRASSLARRLADQLQLPTQSLENQILASFAILVGNGELWRCDPTGQFWKCQAAVIGCHANKAEAILWKRLQGDNVCQRIQEMSSEDALALLQECLEESFATKHASGGASNKMFWQAMVQYHSEDRSESSSPPRRMFQRGAFAPRVSVEPTIAKAS